MTRQSNSSTTVVRLGHGGGGMLTGEAAGDTGKTIRRLLTYLRPYRFVCSW
ncbi:MAG: hypothetical protein R2932_34930 [Caldilineaceae bacterium]